MERASSDSEREMTEAERFTVAGTACADVGEVGDSECAGTAFAGARRRGSIVNGAG